MRPTWVSRSTALVIALLTSASVCAGMLLAVPTQALAVTYSYVRTIGGPGPGAVFNPQDVAVTQTGLVLVTSANGLSVYTRAGGYLTVFTSFHGTPLDYPIGIDIDPRTGDIYVANRLANTIHRLNWNLGWLNDCGSHSTTRSAPGFGDLDGGIAFGGRDEIFGPDHVLERIGAYDYNGWPGSFGGWGTGGTGPGQFVGPSCIDFSDVGLAYVGDYTNGRVQVYGPLGNYLYEWSADPNGISIDPAGNVYVALEQYNARVARFDLDGHKLDDFGPLGSVNTSSFGSADGVREDGHRHVLVVDGSRQRVIDMSTTVPTTYTAAAGADRYETAVEVSKESYPYGLMLSDPEGWGSVVVASGADWPDALGAAPLAGAFRCPLLLVRPDSVPAAVSAEIQRLGAGRIFLIGGTGAVSDAVKTQLGSIPGVAGRVFRIAGADRYETSRKCAEKATFANPLSIRWVFVTTGADFPDALAASPIAAGRRAGIYLCSKDSTSIAAQLLLDGAQRVVILGGTGAVTSVTENALKSAFGAGSVQRWAGSDRYDTSVQIASHAATAAAGASNLGRLAIATGVDFPDALGGGPAVGRNMGVLLLTKPTAVPSQVSSLLHSRKAEVYRVWYLGGTGAVSNTVRTTVHGLLY